MSAIPPPSQQHEQPHEQSEQSQQQPQPPHQPPAGPPTGNRFFSWVRSLGIVREPGWIGGVAAGIAGRFGLDPILIRGIIVVIAIFGGPALLLYAAAWLLLPDHTDRIHLEDIFRGRVEGAVLGIGILAILAFTPIAGGLWLGFDGRVDGIFGVGLGALWTVSIIVAIVWLIVWLVRRGSGGAKPATPASSVAPDQFAGPPTTATASPTPEAPTMPPAPGNSAPPEEVAAWREQQLAWKTQHDAYRLQLAGQRAAASRAAQEQARIERMARAEAMREQRARTRSNPLYSFVVIGVALVAGGLVTLIPNQGGLEVEAILAGVATSVAILALGIIINGARGKRAGGASAVAALLLIPLIFAAIFPQGSKFSYGRESYFYPQDRGGWEQDLYVAAFGTVQIDLMDYYKEPSIDAEIPYGDYAIADPVSLYVGMGDVTVILPPDDFVRADVEVGSGTIDTGGATTEDVPVTMGRGSQQLYADFGPDTRSFANMWDANGELTQPEPGDPYLREIFIDIHVGSGTVTFIQPERGITS